KVLVKRKVAVEECRTLVKSLGVRIDNARNISVEDATICQLHGNAVVEIRSEWMSNSLGRIGWHQALQIASRDISCLTWVEVTAEPETLMTTSNIQLNPLVRAQRGITIHEETGTNAAPQAATPITEGGDLPSPDQVIQSL